MNSVSCLRLFGCIQSSPRILFPPILSSAVLSLAENFDGAKVCVNSRYRNEKS